MQVFKFRAWHTEHKKYYYFTFDTLKYELWYPEEGGFDVIIIPGTEIDISDGIKNGILIIEQFTGLHDKNGKEIYEGDIVHSERFHIRQKYRVIWENSLSKYELSDTEWPADCISMNKEFMSWFEVIGNIHQNPDLL